MISCNAQAIFGASSAINFKLPFYFLLAVDRPVYRVIEIIEVK